MRTSIAALCVLFLAPLPAHAGSIVADDFVGVSVGYYSPVTTGESRAFALGSTPMSHGAGVSAAIDGLAFEAYCVDILGPIFDPGTPQPPAAFSARAASMVAWNLYAGALPTAGASVAWLYNSYAATIASSNDDLQRTGLQMAIWNTLYDDDFTVDSGAFRVSASDTAARVSANTYLAALSSNLPAAAASDATWLQLEDCSVSPCRDVQDFVGPGLTQATPVPEPASVALTGAGLVGLALAHRARRASRA